MTDTKLKMYLYRIPEPIESWSSRTLTSIVSSVKSRFLLLNGEKTEGKEKTREAIMS